MLLIFTYFALRIVTSSSGDHKGGSEMEGTVLLVLMNQSHMSAHRHLSNENFVFGQVMSHISFQFLLCFLYFFHFICGVVIDGECQNG